MYTLEAGRELVDTAAHELPVVVNLTFLLLDCERVSGRRDEVSRARVYPARVRGDWLVDGRLDIVGGGGLEGWRWAGCGGADVCGCGARL